MAMHYLAVALRNMRGNWLFATVNLLGLTVAMTTALLTTLYIRHEMSYDNFWPHAEEIYRLDGRFDRPGVGWMEIANTQSELIEPLKLDYPAVKYAARLDRDRVGFKIGDVEANQAVAWVDSDLFRIFETRPAAGDLDHALERPDGAVLTVSTARKYFGRSDPIGETILIGKKQSFVVAAVIPDLPDNTELTQEVYLSGRSAMSSLTYYDTHPPAPGDINQQASIYFRIDAAAVPHMRETLDAFYDRHVQQNGQKTNSIRIAHLASVHTNTDIAYNVRPSISPATLAAFGFIAALIVATASINFLNLFTARASRRAVEVGVRQVCGARRRDLMIQFLVEAAVFSAFSLLLALSLSELILPAFGALMHARLSLDFWHDPWLMLYLPLLVALVSLAAGSYPAYVLAAVRPVGALKAQAGQSAHSGLLREMLVLGQFAVLIVLAIMTGVIQKQTQFGLDRALRAPSDQVFGAYSELCGRPEVIQQFRNVPGVVDVVCSQSAPMNFSSSSQNTILDDGREIQINTSVIGAGFYEFFGLKPLAGRFFDSDRLTERQYSDLSPVVINERAIRYMGYRTAQDAIGHFVRIGGGDNPAIQIIGVTPDFPVTGAWEPVRPTIYKLGPLQMHLMLFKVRGAAMTETFRGIDAIWNANESGPMRRQFLDQYFQDQYASFRQLGELFAALAAIALSISCLGLFGLSAFAADRRTKEIGIRKALGGSTTDVLRLLVWQFTRPVIWANLIAAPAAFFIARYWLNGFAYRIDLDPLLFVLAGAFAFAIAIGTTAGHALMVARAKPVTALRYE